MPDGAVDQLLQSREIAMSGVPDTGQREAEAIALEVFGLKVRAADLHGERDRNFLLSEREGEKRRFVLKIANAGDGASMVDLQQGALRHLGAGVPGVVPTIEGEGSRVVTLGSGAEHVVWAMTFVDGSPLAELAHHSPALLEEIGCAAGRLRAALRSFDHPALHRVFHWDLAHGLELVAAQHVMIRDPDTAATVEYFSGLIAAALADVASQLPLGAIHNDLNDHNILVDLVPGLDGNLREHVAGVVDFGDLVHSYAVGELAVALAYVMLDKDDPLEAAAHVVRGFHRESPLTETELRALFPLSCLRMCMSLCMSAAQRRDRPGNEYLSISELPMRRAIERVRRIPFRLAEAVMRDACGLPASTEAARITSWLREQKGRFAPLLDTDVRTEPVVVLDLSVASALVSGDPAQNEEAALTRRIFGALYREKARVGIGRYDEPRLLYTADFFGSSPDPLSARRTIHLGMDLFAEAGTPVFAPLDGVVHAFASTPVPQDYGSVIVLRHDGGETPPFFTLYGHLSAASLEGMEIGRTIMKGERFAFLGMPHENVGWTPHLHFQVITDLLELGTDYPGVGEASRRGVWLALSPDPNMIVGLPATRLGPAGPSRRFVQDTRAAHMGGNLKLAYRTPLQVMRGYLQHVHDETGRRFLDAFNNVPHVGHSHPRVVQAVSAQMSVLNTNTRYLHPLVSEYARRLCATFPEPLNVCYLVNSGSEATELAIRLARAHTRRTSTIVLEAAYHGNTGTAIDLSPYKHAGPGGRGRPAWVHVAPQPDIYRGQFREDDPRAGEKYAAAVGTIIDSLHANDDGLCAFLAETCPSVGGQIMPPADYFENVYQQVRQAGGLCIADEVQTGFGRLGTHFWAFERYAVVPDIVVLGKPMANGFPMGAVITTPDIARSFDNGMEFFSTFGGSTVACAAGLEVLNVMRDEQLQAHARRVGARMSQVLRRLGDKHPLVGDVRGAGLFWGVELVLDRELRTPARHEAALVVEWMRERGVLIGTDGPDHNVLKIRPPMPFTEVDAELLGFHLDAVLATVGHLVGPTRA